jgi:predicted TIM-barrel fold metal-dependent hydrolase
MVKSGNTEYHIIGDTQEENPTMDMNRRGFLKVASQFTVTVASISTMPGSSRGAEDGKTTSSIPIIDTHQHLWDLSRFKLPWLRPPLDRSFTPKDYGDAVQGLPVVKAVYMEVAVAREQRVQEAEYAIRLCKDPAGLTHAAVIAGSPADDDFEPYVMRFRNSPYVKGVRGALPSGERMNDKAIIRGLRFLGEMGLRFDLNVPPQSLADAARLVDQCPDTRFVLDHCGNADPVAFFPADRTSPRPAQHSPEQWKRGIDDLAAKTNVVCKISGIVDNVPGYVLTADDVAPIVNHCLDTFGPGRVMFASDWPVCLIGMPLRDWVGLLTAVVAGRPQTDRRKLFHDNAAAFYELDLENRRDRRYTGTRQKDIQDRTTNLL